jgi:hypothetical protein
MDVIDRFPTHWLFIVIETARNKSTAYTKGEMRYVLVLYRIPSYTTKNPSLLEILRFLFFLNEESLGYSLLRENDPPAE